MNKKGFSTLEACMLLILFVAAGLTMYGYVRRAVQGNWRSNIDSFSDEQYEKGISTETAPQLTFSGSRLTAIDHAGNAFWGGSCSSAGDIRISGWGVYEGEADEE